MKKVSLIFLISFLLFLSINTSVLAAEPRVLLDDYALTFDAPVINEKGRLLVPLRTIFENLDAEIEWHDETKTVIARKDNTTIKLTINSKVVLKNGAVFELDVPARLANGRTLVPLRFVGEALGAVVSWDAPNNTVTITSGEIDETKEQDYSKHIGKWQGKSAGGKMETFVFYKDGTMSKVSEGKSYRMKYKIDYTKNPVWLDFTYNDTIETKFIVKFNSPSEMYYYTYENATRPTNFLDLGVTLTKVEEPDFGVTDQEGYTNKFFGLKIGIPDGWYVLDAETAAFIRQLGEETMAGEDVDQQASIEQSSRDSLQLLTIFRHPPGAAVSSNPSFICIAEGTDGLPGIKKGSDYLFHVKEILQKSASPEFTFEKEIYTEQVGSQSFDVLEANISALGVTVKQKYYCTIIKGYALTFLLSYSTGDELNDLNDILKTVSFN